MLEMVPSKTSRSLSRRFFGSRISSKSLSTLIISLASFILVLSPLCFNTVSGQEDINSSSLVVGENEELVIFGPEYAVKGNVVIREGGSLEIRDTDFEIFQEEQGQYEVILERSASLKLVDSELISEKEISMELDPGSELELVNSSMGLPGEMTGSAKSVEVIDSKISAGKINLNLDDSIMSQRSVIDAERTLISSPEAHFELSVLHTELILHSYTEAALYGSSLESIDVKQNSEAEIYGELSISLKDLLGIPVGGAEIRVERRDDDWEYISETDRDGRWNGFIPSEIIDPERSLYKGNYHISVEHSGITNETAVSFPPVEKMTPDRGLDEISVNRDMKLSRVVPPSDYYHDSDFDLVVDGDKEIDIETYPNEGIDNYIQDGNIYLDDQGTLKIGENSRFKVLQRDERYRVEMRGSSELKVQNDGSIRSDRPLNIYLYGDSSLSLDGADLEIGSLYMGGSSTFTAKNTRIDAEHIRFQGEHFEVQDSILNSKSLDVEAENLTFRGSSVDTAYNVTLAAEDFEIVDMDFVRSVFFKSEVAHEISITNVTADEIVPLGDITINRRWRLYVEIYNGEDRLVPFVDMDIYRQGPLERELVESMLVEDGRVEVPLKSEIITSDRTRFVGNYVLEAEKEVNGDMMYSETSMIAVDGNRETEIRFLEEFPYSIVVDVEVPSEVAPNEVFEIRGRATYEGTGLQVENAVVEIVIERQNDDMIWNTTTDSQGRFELDVEAPTAVGTYPLQIRVDDEYMRMEAEETRSLEVTRGVDGTINHFLFVTTIGRFMTVLIIIVLMIFAYKLTNTLFEKEKVPGLGGKADITERILNQE